VFEFPSFGPPREIFSIDLNCDIPPWLAFVLCKKGAVCKARRGHRKKLTAGQLIRDIALANCAHGVKRHPELVPWRHEELTPWLLINPS
jgi:hypothetical protein